jgi:hypothetical protein
MLTSFFPQAYCPGRETDSPVTGEPEVTASRGPEVTRGLEVSRGTEILSPDSDPLESEHSGSTETGQPIQLGVGSCLLSSIHVVNILFKEIASRDEYFFECL